MSGIFETHKVTILKNDIVYRLGTKQLVGEYTPIVEHLSCHIGRISKGKTGQMMCMYILRKYLDPLKELPERGFKVIDEDSLREYKIEPKPVWGGGYKHHLECDMEEFV